MAATGGDILEITCNHPTQGTVTFYPKSNEDSTFDPGGFRGVDDANMVDGAGRLIRQMNRVRAMFEVTIAKDDNTEETMEVLAAIAASPADAVWTVTHINGSVWKINGAPVGDIQGNMNQGTMTLKVAGSVLEKTQG